VVTPDPANLGKKQAAFTKAGAVKESAPVGASKERLFENKLALSHVGGNKYKVAVTKQNKLSRGGKATAVSADGQGGGTVLDIETYRKIFFSIQYMRSVRAEYDEVKGNLKTLFDKAFIEMEGPITPENVNVEIDDLETIESDDAHKLGLAKESKPAPGTPAEGLWIRFVLVRRIINDMKSVSRTLSALVDGDARLLAPAEGSNQWGFTFELPGGADLNPPRYGRKALGDSPSVAVTFEGDYNAKYVADDKLQLAVVEEGRRINVRFRDDAINEQITAALRGPTKKKVKFEFYDRAGKDYAGMSSNANIAIAVEAIKRRYRDYWSATNPDWATLVPKAVLKAIAHEVCHSMGGPIPEIEGVAHPHHYTQDKGGLAPPPKGHCGFNTELRNNVDLNDPQREPRAHYRKLHEAGGVKTQITVPKTDTVPTCIMFHSLFPATTHNAEFCDDCIKQMRLLDLSPEALAKWKTVT